VVSCQRLTTCGCRVVVDCEIAGTLVRLGNVIVITAPLFSHELPRRSPDCADRVTALSVVPDDHVAPTLMIALRSMLMSTAADANAVGHTGRSPETPQKRWCRGLPCDGVEPFAMRRDPIVFSAPRKFVTFWGRQLLTLAL